MKIYLASASRARRALLKSLGLKFSVIPTGIKEKRVVRNGDFGALAERNALDKAKAAGKKIKSGIIISADTIVVQNGKLFGKPRNLRDAHAMLKKLSSKPHTLYSGICVMDKDKGRVLSGCEKTEIHMDKLSDEEISGYFRKVNPLDKAGGFDIQGKGALFIRRIEGCFYNVIGLPLSALYRMLKKLDVRLLILLIFSGLLFGCSTEYNVVTGKEESYYFTYTTDNEVIMGKNIAKQVEEEYKLYDDPLVTKRVKDIGKRIVAVCDRKEIDYEFKVLDSDEVNAVALPGGIVYIFRGLIEKINNDDELAGVIAHEVGHIVARHSIKKLQALQAYSILRLLVAAAPNAQGVGQAADAAFIELLLGYSREDELLADQLGARYEKLAGYNPQGMIQLLNKLQDINRRSPLKERSYYKTHPYVPDRIRVVKGELGQNMDFDDYINIEQLTHGQGK
jgi:MAF protein